MTMTPEEIGSGAPIIFGPEAQPHAHPDAGSITNILGHTFEVQSNGDRLMDGCYYVPAKEWTYIQRWLSFAAGYHVWGWLLGTGSNAHIHDRLNGQALPTMKILGAVRRIVAYNSKMQRV